MCTELQKSQYSGLKSHIPATYSFYGPYITSQELSFLTSKNEIFLLSHRLGLSIKYQDFAGGTVDGSLPANPGDMGLIPGPGKFHMPLSN